MIVVDVSKFDQQRFYLLTHKIKNTKSQYDQLIEEDDMAMKGRRYNDDERIARMVVGKIYGECNYDIEEAKKKFLALNSTDIEPYIKYAVLDSAGADHWYTYEKRWD